MSTLETILNRMMTDSIFAELVFTDAANALAEYKLSSDELARFKSMSRADFEAMIPEDRKSFGWQNHNQTILQVH